jgi:hypothetical protein
MMEDYKLYWWRGKEHNFGDEITPWLFNKMCGITQISPCNIKSEKNVLLAVGSIMRLSSSKTVVWGSGIRNIDQSDFSCARKYCAVRGPFTKRQLNNLGFSCPSIFGDPGLLLPNYYKPKIKKKFKLGIIPHISEFEELKKHFSKFPEIKIISLKTNNIEKTVNEILECEFTVSTSLHGIITSVAYGIPTRWLKYSNKINGDDIKFYDFFASLDPALIKNFDFSNKRSKLDKYNPLIFSTNFTMDHLISSTFQYSMSNIDLNLLIDSCPIKILNR